MSKPQLNYNISEPIRNSIVL